MVRQLPEPARPGATPPPHPPIAVEQPKPSEGEWTEAAAPQAPQTPALQACQDNGTMDSPAPADPHIGPQSESHQTPSVPPARRKRTFPVRFLVKQDEKGRPIDSRMFYAHEWEEYQAAQREAEHARKEAEEAAKTALEAERAAGRPSDAQRPSQPSTELGRQFPIDDAKAAFACFARSISQASTSFPPPDFSRHSRRCLVCAHPDRDAIEGEFIRWRSPIAIAEDYGLADRNSIYRHAHATGLLQRRRSEAARVLENVLERGESCPTAEFDVITRAVRLYTSLDDDSRRHEPPRTNYLFTAQIDPSSIGIVPAANRVPASEQTGPSNRRAAKELISPGGGSKPPRGRAKKNLIATRPNSKRESLA